MTAYFTNSHFLSQSEDEHTAREFASLLIELNELNCESLLSRVLSSSSSVTV